MNKFNESRITGVRSEDLSAHEGRLLSYEQRDKNTTVPTYVLAVVPNTLDSRFANSHIEQMPNFIDYR